MTPLYLYYNIGSARNILHNVHYNIVGFRHFSFNKLLLQKEELEQRHLHLLQVVESEMTAKWQYAQQVDESASEIKKLRAEVKHNIINELIFPCSLKSDMPIAIITSPFHDYCGTIHM